MSDNNFLNVEKTKHKVAFAITLSRVDGLPTTAKNVHLTWKRGNLSGETKVRSHMRQDRTVAKILSWLRQCLVAPVRRQHLSAAI